MYAEPDRHISIDRYSSLLEKDPDSAARLRLYRQQRYQHETPGYRGGYPWGLQFRSLNDARLLKRGDHEAHAQETDRELDLWIRKKPHYVAGCEDPAVRADPVYRKVLKAVRRVVEQKDRSQVPAQWRDAAQLEQTITGAFIGMYAKMFTRQMDRLDYAWFQEATPREILGVFCRPVRSYTSQELDERDARRAKQRAVTMRASARRSR